MKLVSPEEIREGDYIAFAQHGGIVGVWHIPEDPILRKHVIEEAVFLSKTSDLFAVNLSPVKKISLKDRWYCTKRSSPGTLTTYKVMNKSEYKKCKNEIKSKQLYRIV